MLPSYFDYILVHRKQKVRFRPELSPQVLSTLDPNPARTRPEKPGPTYKLSIINTFNKKRVKRGLLFFSLFYSVLNSTILYLILYIIISNYIFAYQVVFTRRQRRDVGVIESICPLSARAGLRLEVKGWGAGRLQSEILTKTFISQEEY